MYTQAVPSEYISSLLKTLKPRQSFSILNNTRFTVPYQIQWTEGGVWYKISVDPDQWYIHWSPESLKKAPQGYPKIRFDCIADGEKATLKSYNLKTYTRIFGADVKKRIRREDSHKYHFRANFGTEEFDLYDSEKK